jgi:hypothetical protein
MRRHAIARNAHKQVVAAGPIHENGILSASTVSGQRFRSGGGRPVFGLWAAYSVAASHLAKDSALAHAMQRFVPITAAGQRWIFTSFPFNKSPMSDLTCTYAVYPRHRHIGE